MRVINEALYREAFRSLLPGTPRTLLYSFGLIADLDESGWASFASLSDLAYEACVTEILAARALELLATQELITVMMDEGNLSIFWNYIIPHHPANDRPDLENAVIDLLASWVLENQVTAAHLERLAQLLNINTTVIAVDIQEPPDAS